MPAEHDALVQRLFERAAEQGLSIDTASAPQDPAALLAFLHEAAQGETLPETVEKLLAALGSTLLRS